MSKRLYRVMDPVNESYYSEVSGCVRLEEYNYVNRAYAYDKTDALAIAKSVERLNEELMKIDSIPDEVKNKYQSKPIVVEITIDDVRISKAEQVAAINSAPALGLSGSEAIRQARWRRVRRYKEYYHYDPRTLSHQYIYTHSFF